ncbi:MAG: rhomboid family intramembrane serine protease [Candidatus Eisenbacteria bacterium]|nr:rhomboid family intramembrane serine protease [Candidatus Eisenbacteria bacterium]
MICPECGKLIGVGEPRCPFCGAWRPGLYGVTPRLQRLFGGRLDLVGVIVASCVALYVLALALDPGAIMGGGLFNLLSPSDGALGRLGMTSAYDLATGRWWTLLTAIYLHGGLLHIFFNVMWIRQLGPAVTETYGPARAFVIFSLAGVAGFMLSDRLSPYPSVGASGSIFGLLAALIVYGRRRGGTHMTAQLWQWAIALFVIGLIPGMHVNNWAHAGGFAGGWLAATAMRFGDEKRESVLVQALALALLALTAAGVVLSLLNTA